MKVRSLDSSLWKDVARTIPSMLETGRWIVGDGKNIKAWNDNWLGLECCVADLDVMIPDNLKGAFVCDLITDTGDWNLSMLQNWLPAYWIENIMVCVPPCVDNGTDVFCFAGTCKDKFSIKVMFNELEGFNNNATDTDWIKIWKASVPERCKSFMWLFKHNRLLTNHSKSQKGLGSACCNRCGFTCETCIHALRNCPFSNQIWQKLIPNKLRREFFVSNSAEWIRLNLNCKSDGWCSTWIIACHALWSWRNEEEHNDNYLRPCDPIMQISQRCRDYKQVVILHKAVGSEKIGSNSIGWIPPVRGMIKLNTDGASKSDNSSGCGGILRDYKGDWKGDFSKFVGRSSALLAELWGVYEGLNLAQRLNYFNVEINVDSAQVVKALEDGKVEAIDCGVILSRILQQLARMEAAVITHVARSSNSCADSLANKGCLEKALVFYENTPRFLEPLLHDDRIGICNPSVACL